MRLTVGPLPAAVYWRRRLVVLVGLAMVGLVVWYACSSPAPNVAGAPLTSSATASAGDGSSPATGQSPSVTLPDAIYQNTCADSDMKVTARASATELSPGGRAAGGSQVRFTISIKNSSTRECNRDVGADVQELRLVYGERVIWSSDDCDANTGSDIRSFRPGQEISFTPGAWDGTRTRTGDGVTVECSGVLVEPGVYHLHARLGDILSDPVPIVITAP